LTSIKGIEFPVRYVLAPVVQFLDSVTLAPGQQMVVSPLSFLATSVFFEDIAKGESFTIDPDFFVNGTIAHPRF
jgi:hypothetical protein